MINRVLKAKHLIIAFILVVLVTIGLIFGMNFIRLLPEAASAQARPIDSLFRLEFMVIAFLFSLIVVFMVYSIVAFRRKRGDTSDARHIEGSTNLEVAWTLAPLATVLVFAYLGGGALAATLEPEAKALRVDVTGRQWTWSFASIPYARANAKKAGNSLEAEVQLLIVHGILHLLGHDHGKPKEKAQMWKAQREILESLGLGEVQTREE